MEEETVIITIIIIITNAITIIIIITNAIIAIIIITLIRRVRKRVTWWRRLVNGESGD